MSTGEQLVLLHCHRCERRLLVPDGGKYDFPRALIELKGTDPLMVYRSALAVMLPVPIVYRTGCAIVLR